MKVLAGDWFLIMAHQMNSDCSRKMLLLLQLQMGLNGRFLALIATYSGKAGFDSDFIQNAIHHEGVKGL